MIFHVVDLQDEDLDLQERKHRPEDTVLETCSVDKGVHGKEFAQASSSVIPLEDSFIIFKIICDILILLSKITILF